MSDPKVRSPQGHASWHTYWLGAEDAAAFSAGGTSHPLILGFWADFFAEISQDRDSPKIIDIASGNGAVVECANSATPRLLTDFTCLDISDAAIRTLEGRFPGVNGIVADARSIPLESATFDLLVSQFGLEYGGPDAIDEVLRLLLPGGRLALLLHHRGGGIYRQCAASRDAIESMLKARFIPRAIDVLEAGFLADSGGDSADYDAKVKDFLPAIRALESIMREHGQHVADGTVMRLYRDVRTIHGRLRHYDPAEVLGWLKRLEHEAQGYADRMASMCDAALDEASFRGLCDRLANRGFRIERAEALEIPERKVPLAWVLIASNA